MELLQVLKMYDFDITTKTKLIRHKEIKGDLDLLYNLNMIDFYQTIQGHDIFGKCDYIISFMGEDGTKSRFIGIYKKIGYNKFEDVKPPKGFPYPQMLEPNNFFYELEKTDYLSDLIDRLIIDWGKATKSWHQWLNENSKEVVEILPAGYTHPFPGYEDVCLSFKELERIIKNPVPNKKWKEMLSAVYGIYLIVDTTDGSQYVGSAYGQTNGIWGRWQQYVDLKHGGNKKLIELLESEPDRYNYFQFSILRTLSKNLTQKEVITYEEKYKKVLGSRAFGLNIN